MSFDIKTLRGKLKAESRVTKLLNSFFSGSSFDPIFHLTIRQSNLLFPSLDLSEPTLE